LLSVARIKAVAKDLRVTSLSTTDDALVIRFDQNHKVEGAKLAQAMQRYRGHIAVTMTKAPHIRFKLAGRRDAAMLQLLERLLSEIRG
jgi:transcription-repair coupling factor (superfamily II helicase)